MIRQDDKPTRLRLVAASKEVREPRVAIAARDPASGKCSKVESWSCAPCSEAVGFAFGNLLRVRVGSFVINGRLSGGHWWWCCARCHAMAFHEGPVEKEVGDNAS